MMRRRASGKHVVGLSVGVSRNKQNYGAKTVNPSKSVPLF